MELSAYMLDKTVVQKRKASDTGDSVEAWTEVATGIKMAIYPSSSITIANFQSPYTRIQLSHTGYCKTSAATWQRGDRVIEGSNIYTVLGVRTWNNLYELKIGIQ